MVDGLFISYRRHDASGHAGRLRDHLRARYGQRVFQDVDNIPDGEIFEDVLGRALATCRVGLVVIGPRWLDAIDDAGRRRVDAPDDWVRAEIRQLLKREIRVIPVLVGGARLPSDDSLPDDLKSLAKRQARELRDSSWDADVSALIKGLDEALSTSQTPEAAAKPVQRRSLAWTGSLALIVLVAAIGTYSWLGSEMSDPRPPFDAAPISQSPALTLSRAKALGLPGTLWLLDSDPPEPYEFIVRDGAVLLQSAGNGVQKRMLVKQIQDHTITLVDLPLDGRFIEYMFAYQLASDGSALDKCQTQRIPNGTPVGGCSWSFRRAWRAPAASAITLVPTIR